MTEPDGPEGWQREFLQRMSVLGDTTGLPPSFMQVFAWLIVCEPPAQSVEQLRAALGLSAGAISAATTTLIHLGLVERVSHAGQRRLYYRMRPWAWERLLRLRLDASRQITATADDALAQVPGPHERLREMRDVMAHFEATLTSLLGEAVPPPVDAPPRRPRASPREFEPGPLAAVAYEVTGGRATLVVERDLRHPPEQVWVALTDPAQLGQWAPYTADRDLGHVGEAVLTMLDAQSNVDLPAAVTIVEPPAVLEYTWGTDILRWELTPIGIGTHLTLRHTVQHVDFAPKAAAGWHLCLVVAEHLLDRDPIAPIRGEDARGYGWDGLNEAYADLLGLPASGPPED